MKWLLRILVTGASGRLGAVLSDELLAAGHDVVALGHADLDITSTEQVTTAVSRCQPDVIVNCAGCNAVDAAEHDRGAAFAVNADGPALLAAAAAAHGALLVHYSSDFVFDGEAERPYTETDVPNPLSVYGSSKLAGETAVRQVKRHVILRVESLFGGSGVRGHRATIDYIADTLASGTRLRVALDRTVTPSYAPDVARATRSILESFVPYGTYHCVSSGPTTWYDLAFEVARHLRVEPSLEPVWAADLRTEAPRPRYCALSNEKLASFGIPMPTWQSAVQRHLECRARAIDAAGLRS